MRDDTRAVDVVVVGAGLAGLTAARSVRREGRTVALLEARDRVGGRTFTRFVRDDTQIQLGAQWIGPSQKHMFELVGEYGLDVDVTPSEGHELIEYDGRRLKGFPAKVRKLLGRLDRMTANFPLESPWTHEDAAHLDRQTFASWLDRQRVPEAAKRFTGRLIAGGLLAGDAGDFSMLEVLFYIASGGGTASMIDCVGGAQNFCIRGGPSALTQKMAEELADDLRLGEPVRRIEHDAHSATVVTDKASYKAAHVIVAIPPTLAGRIDYSPALPSSRDGLAQRMPAGYALKMHAIYERPFWRDKGLAGIAVSDRGVLSETFDSSPPDSSCGVLVSFAYGAEARKLRTASPAELRATVVHHLVDLYGDEAAKAEDFVSFDWTAEPWTRGCFSGHFTPGSWLGYGPALRAPVGVLHWAGTETAVNWNGYMDGAVESGKRAAEEITSDMHRKR